MTRITILILFTVLFASCGAPQSEQQAAPTQLPSPTPATLQRTEPTQLPIRTSTPMSTQVLTTTPEPVQREILEPKKAAPPNAPVLKARQITPQTTSEDEIILLNEMQLDFGIKEVKYSPDGRLLALGGKKLAVLDTESGKILWTEAERYMNYMEIEYSTDGSKLGVRFNGSSAGIRVYDSSSGTRLWEVDTGTVGKAFSPDGRFFAVSSSNRELIVWDSQTDTSDIRIMKSSFDVLAYSPDGKTIALDQSGIQLLDISQREDPKSVSPSGADAAFYSHRGDKLIVNDENRSEVSVFDVDNLDTAAGPILTLPGKTPLLNPVDESLALVIRSSTIGWVHLDSATVSFAKEEMPLVNDMWDLDFSPDGSVLVVVGERTWLWDTETEDLLLTLDSPAFGPWGASFSPIGDAFAISGGRNLYIWGLLP